MAGGGDADDSLTLITGGTEEWAALRAAWEWYAGAPTQGGAIATMLVWLPREGR